MSDSNLSSTTISNIGVKMFSVADQDAARAFYTEKLGFEVRADDRFGEHDDHRWLEVAPPGSTARLALNPPMGGQPAAVRSPPRRTTSSASTLASRRWASTSPTSRSACPALR